MKTWPDHYPENCPPSNANESVGQLYRFTNKNIPDKEDFYSYFDLFPRRKWGEKACQARGLSVFNSIDDCLAAASAVPALKKKKLSVAKLSGDYGVIVQTPSANTKNHITLWPLINAQELSNLFSNVSVVG